MRSRDNHADAHLSGKVYIGHHRDLLNIWGGSESLKRLRHVSIQRRSEPAFQRSHRRITHRRLPAPRPARTTALALAFWRSPLPPPTADAMHRYGVRSSHRRRSSRPAQLYGPVDDRNPVLAKPHPQTDRSQCRLRLNPQARGSAHAVLAGRAVVSSVALGGCLTDCRFLLHRESRRSASLRTPLLYLDVGIVSQSSLLRAGAQSLQAHERACGFNS